MRLSLGLLVVLLLVHPVAAGERVRPATCEVHPLWVIPNGVRSANLSPIGSFQLDGKEGRSLRSFNFGDTGLVVTAGVDFKFGHASKYPWKTTPYEIRLAITVSDKEEEDIFESVDSAEARTLYGKGWNLAVSKNVNFDNRVYIFTLSCRDAAKAPRR